MPLVVYGFGGVAAYFLYALKPTNTLCQIYLVSELRMAPDSHEELHFCIQHE